MSTNISDKTMKDIAVRAEHVSKMFKLYDNPVTGPLKEFLFFWNRKNFSKQFCAINDVSMEIQRGKVVGVIGPNGAGKTTFLKMIAGLLVPTGGRIQVNGKVTALLALGVGFNAEFTGRENIFYGGMLLGMSKAEVLAKMESIIAFAEVGDFIDRPLRTYSSGMRARLVFATSMSINPDILIIDEALATGDSHFLRKSAERIRQLCQSGATILLVSHNMNHIVELCDEAYFINEGRIIDHGNPHDMVARYNQWLFEKEKKHPFIIEGRKLPLFSGSGEVKIQDIELRGADGEISTGFYSGEPMRIDIRYSSTHARRIDLFLGFLLTRNLSYVGEINTFNHLKGFNQSVCRSRIDIEKEGCISIAIDSLLLLNNHYSLWIILHEDNEYLCEYKNVFPFFVSRRENVTWRDAFFWHPCTISHNSAEEHARAPLTP